MVPVLAATLLKKLPRVFFGNFALWPRLSSADLEACGGVSDSTDHAVMIQFR